MTNTQLRILSAFFMVLAIVIASYLGRTSMLVLVGIVGILVVEEFVGNICKISRTHFGYIFSMLTFIGGYAFFNFVDVDINYFSNAANVGLAINGLLLYYLFKVKMESKKVITSIQSMSYLIGLAVLIPFLCLSWILHKNEWGMLLILLGLLNFVVDSAAWFFGKKYGKKKLWPQISPKKTINGAIGGALTGVIVSSLFSYFLLNKLSILLIIAFFGVALCAQLGDLVQSKFKRQAEIKDSSNLIPGHGGMYDRVDSLIFVAPVFAMILKYFY